MSKVKRLEKNQRSSLMPAGPYTTGCCDLMVGKGVEGTLLRVFYPTTFSNIQEHQSQWTSWYLGKQYSKGLAHFFMPWLSPLYQFLSNKMSRNSVIPAMWEAPIAEGLYPLVIFSHGLAAHRSLYSSICNDIASHGFFVAAIEHRDRSACATFILKEDGKKEWLYIKLVPSHKQQFDIRFSQVQNRAAECSKALNVLQRLNRGEIERNELPSSLSLRVFKGRIDTSNAILAGHSFGGATTVLALARDKRFKGGVCLDPWMFPLHALDLTQSTLSEQDVEELKTLSESIDQPLLFILMEGFQDKKNLKALKQYEEKKWNKFWTLLKAVHQNQTDTPVIFRDENPTMKEVIGCSSVIHPDTALRLNNNLMVNFICNTLNIRTSYCEDYETFIYKNSRWATEGAFGTAKCMVGWHSKPIKKAK